MTHDRSYYYRLIEDQQYVNHALLNKRRTRQHDHA
jgi:hypothetical protein